MDGKDKELWKYKTSSNDDLKKFPNYFKILDMSQCTLYSDTAPISTQPVFIY